MHRLRGFFLPDLLVAGMGAGVGGVRVKRCGFAGPPAGRSHRTARQPDRRKSNARQIAAAHGKGFGQGWSVGKSYLASEGAFRAINNVA